MTFVSLSTRLAEIHAENSVGLVAIDHALSDVHTSQAGVRTEIQRLQQQLRELNAQVLVQEQIREDHLVVHLRHELAATCAALAASYANIAQAGSYWQTLIDMYQCRAEMLERYPNLLVNLEAYRAFEHTDPAMLQALPTYHRDLALEGQRQLRECLIPYLELEEREQALDRRWNVALQIAVVHDPAESEIHWILPFPAELESLPHPTSNALQTVASHVLTALSKIQQHPNWYIAELSTSAWSNYTVLHALAEQKSEEDLVENTRLLVLEQLGTIPIFEHMMIDVHVAALSVGTWERGLQGEAVGGEATNQRMNVASPALLDEATGETASTEQPEKSTLQANEETRLKQRNTWYTDADILSWERPVKAVEKSRWNSEARRLRTVLMRLVAQGMIGDQTVDIMQLWSPLPAPHDEAVRNGITRMIQAGILMEAGSVTSTEGRVAINPAMLPEIQTLINRDVAGVWINLITS